MSEPMKNAEGSGMRHEQTLRTIARLQNMEQKLYQQLSDDYKSGKFTTTTPAKHCSDENQDCICPNGSTVEYGVGTSWNDKPCPQNGMIGCNDEIFGDSTVGKGKSCRIKAASVQNTEQIKSVVDRINELSQTRVNLFESLKDDYEDKQDLVKGTHENLVKQYTNAKVVEHKMNTTKQHMRSIQDDNYNKLRMVQINQYSSDRYYAYSKLFKLFVIIIIPIIIIGVISKTNIIPDRYVSRGSINDILLLLLVVAIFIGVYFFIKQYSDIAGRDNMNFQEYNWRFNPNDQPGVIAYDEKELDIFKKDAKSDFSKNENLLKNKLDRAGNYVDNKYKSLNGKGNLNKDKSDDGGIHPLDDVSSGLHKLGSLGSSGLHELGSLGSSGLHKLGGYGSAGLHKLGGYGSAGLHKLDSMGNSLMDNL